MTLSPRLQAIVDAIPLRPYDIVFAVRVGALDGRHPEAGARALERIAQATTADARLFVDGGDPLRELPIPRTRGQV